jgi:Flp pilus assembly protein TadB
VEQMLQNQARDIELRGEQLELAKQQEQHAFDYSQASLDAQLTDRREQRATQSGTIKHLCWIVVLIIFLVLAFFGTLILTGHEVVALELAKVLIYGGLGAAGGYGVAKSRKVPEIGE